MSIELLPFSAFALESCAAPAPAPGEGQTLTLPLRMVRAAGTETMTGQLSLHATSPALQDSRHAGIARLADAAPLTLTF